MDIPQMVMVLNRVAAQMNHILYIASPKRFPQILLIWHHSPHVVYNESKSPVKFLNFYHRALRGLEFER